MYIQTLILLFMFIICSATVQAQPTNNSMRTMYSDVNDHINLVKGNNVINSIWKSDMVKSCDMPKPPEDSLNKSYFVNFNLNQYLCLILYDSSIYMLNSFKHIQDDSVRTMILDMTADSILHNSPAPSKFCQEMKQLALPDDTNVQWIKHLNSLKQDAHRCQKGCIDEECQGSSDCIPVNPLCAFILRIANTTLQIEHSFQIKKVPEPETTKPPKINNYGTVKAHVVQPQMQVDDSPVQPSLNVLMRNNANHQPASGNRAIVQSAGLGKKSDPVIQPKPLPVGSNVLSTDREAGKAGAPQPQPADFTSQPVSAGNVDNTGSGRIDKAPPSVSGLSQATGVKSPPSAGQSGTGNTAASISHNTDTQTAVGTSGNSADKTAPVTAGKPAAGISGNSVAVSDHTIAVSPSKTASNTVKNTADVTLKTAPGISTAAQDNTVADTAEPGGGGAAPKADEELATEGDALSDLNGGAGGELHAAEEAGAESMDEGGRGGGVGEAGGEVAEDQGDSEPQGAAPPLPDDDQQREDQQREDQQREDQQPEDQQQLPLEPPEPPAEDSKPKDGLQPYSEQDEEPPQQRGKGDFADKDTARPGIPEDSDYGGGSMPEGDDTDDGESILNPGVKINQAGADVGPYAHDRFVDAEDSHFFAYFMTMIILCIVGYLIFHNKQKILALALEGRSRRGTRRRPNTSGYRKLDSTLEEAITSNCSGSSVTHVIY